MLDERKEPFVLVAFLRRVYYLLCFVIREQLNFGNGFQKCPFVVIWKSLLKETDFSLPLICVNSSIFFWSSWNNVVYFVSYETGQSSWKGRNNDTSSFYTVISRVTALSFQPYLPLKLITSLSLLLSFLNWFNSGQFLSYFSVNTG